MSDVVSHEGRLSRDAKWVLAGQVGSALGVLAGFRLMTEAVAPDVYGTVVLAVGLVALAQGLVVQPLMQAVLRHYPDYSGGSGVTLLRRTATLVLRRPALLVSLTFLVVFGLWSNQARTGLALGPLCASLFLVEVVRSVQVGFLNAEGRHGAWACFVTADAWLRPVLAVTMVWLLCATASVVIAGYLSGAALSLAGLLVAVQRRGSHPVTSCFSSEETAAVRRRLWTYSRPLVVLPLIGWVSGQADRYIVGGLVGVGYAGMYAAVYGLASRPFLMLRDGAELALRQVYYARVSEGDIQAQQRVFVVWLGVVMAAALAMLLLISLLHREIAEVLLATEYRAYSSLMVWIATGYVLAVCCQVVERILYAHHDTKGVLLVEASGAVLSVLVAIPMVLYYGVRGAAMAVPIYFALQLTVAVLRTSRVSRS